MFESRLLSRWARLEPSERRVISLSPPRTLAGPSKSERWGGNDLEEDRAYWKLMEWESPWLPRGKREHAPHQRQAGEGIYILEHIPVFLMMASSFSHIGTHFFLNVHLLSNKREHCQRLSTHEIIVLRTIIWDMYNYDPYPRRWYMRKPRLYKRMGPWKEAKILILVWVPL